jgi:Short C-terminal domain
MMRRRAIGRSMVRTAATTAVIVGTAGAVSHAQQQHYTNQQAQAQQAYDQAYQQGAADVQAQPQYVQPTVQYEYEAPAQLPPADDLTTKLKQLAELHQSGVLTDEEFTAAKQKLLAG